MCQWAQEDFLVAVILNINIIRKFNRIPVESVPLKQDTLRIKDIWSALEETLRTEGESALKT